MFTSKRWRFFSHRHFLLSINMIDGFKLHRGKDWQSYLCRLKVKGCCCSHGRCARKQDVSLGSFTQRHLGAHAVMSLGLCADTWPIKTTPILQTSEMFAILWNMLAAKGEKIKISDNLLSLLSLTNTFSFRQS